MSSQARLRTGLRELVPGFPSGEDALDVPDVVHQANSGVGRGDRDQELKSQQPNLHASGRVHVLTIGRTGGSFHYANKEAKHSAPARPRLVAARTTSLPRSRKGVEGTPRGGHRLDGDAVGAHGDAHEVVARLASACEPPRSAAVQGAPSPSRHHVPNATNPLGHEVDVVVTSEREVDALALEHPGTPRPEPGRRAVARSC